MMTNSFDERSNTQPDGTGASLSLQQFFQLVVPQDCEGYLSIHWHLPDQPFSGRSCRTIQEALSLVAELKAKTKHNIYFCLSCHSGKRDRKHAIGLSCVAADIDVKADSPDHYGSISEAIAALLWTCNRLGIPRPSILVASGGGLHAYWLSDRTLSVEEWQPFADALKAALRGADLKIDPAVTGDVARVLRVPGTNNWKYGAPRLVRVLQNTKYNLCNGVRHDFASVFEKILSEKPSQSRSSSKINPHGLSRNDIAEAFRHLPVTPIDPIVVEDYPPLPFAPIKEGCAWLRHVHDTGGADQSETLWRDALRCCIFLDDGENLIHELGNKHDGYDREATEAKFDRARRDKEDKDLGYPKCQTICDHDSEHCKSCPHLEKGKSPLHLAWQQPAPADDKTPNSLEVWDAGDDHEIPDPRGWLLGNSFCRGVVSSLIAPGGVGKTALRIAQAISLATGRSRTGEHVFVRTRVLLVVLEDDKPELQRRILAALMHHGIDRTELKGWLFLSAPGRRAGKLLSANSRTGVLTTGTLGPLIEAEIVARDIGLVIVDPLVKAHGVNENSNDDMDALVDLLADLASQHNIAIDVPHHVSKGAPDPGNADRGRGASATKDAARLVYTLATMSAAEAEQYGIPGDERRGYIRLDRAKLNTACTAGPADWFRLASVHINNGNATYPAGDEVQTVESWNPPESWAGIDRGTLDTILNTLDHGLGDGNFYSAHNNAAVDRAAWGVITRYVPDKSEEQARIIILTWLKKGLLYKFNYKHTETRKTVQGLRVNNKKRPTDISGQPSD